MKHLPYIFILGIFLLTSCEREIQLTESDIPGDWKLVELLIDPGDLSGVFEPTELDITLTFEANGRVSGNGILCGFGASDTLLEGFYNIGESLISTECEIDTYEHHLVIENNNLIISSMTCREPCRAKFEKI